MARQKRSKMAPLPDGTHSSEAMLKPSPETTLDEIKATLRFTAERCRTKVEDCGWPRVVWLNDTVDPGDLLVAQRATDLPRPQKPIYRFYKQGDGEFYPLLSSLTISVFLG